MPVCLRNAALTLVLVFFSCGHIWEEPGCHRTVQNFVSLFNDQQYRKIRKLFQPGDLGKTQLKRMQENLSYIRSVAGKIQSLELLEQEENMLVYKTTHENTAMEVRFSVNDHCQLKSYQIDTHYPDSLQVLKRNHSGMRLPFEGEWYVVWGGPTLEQNYHNAHRNMQGAFDFSVKDSSGKLFRGSGRKNEDYFAFGKKVLAPCRATVEKVIKGIEDNTVGKPSAQHTYGNAIVLRTDHQEYILLAHLKNGSIRVAEGQRVEPGTLLAQCGNSGYSAEPHLHFILQNVGDLFHPTGATCYFEQILVNGIEKVDYSPVQGELVRNYEP